MVYDYEKGKQRIKNILSDNNDIHKDNGKIPKKEDFTYSNGYYGWVSAIFVDIRDSTLLFAKNEKIETAKIIRAFASEIIEILTGDDNLRDIGIRGDCIFAIYNTPNKDDDYELKEKAVHINTFLYVLNNLLKEYRFDQITAGIGIATNQELVVKAGRKGSSVNDLVWIGKAVTFASKLSNIANKNGKERILMTSLFYENILEKWNKEQGEDKVKSFDIKSYNDEILGKYYGCSIIKTS